MVPVEEPVTHEIQIHNHTEKFELELDAHHISTRTRKLRDLPIFQCYVAAYPYISMAIRAHVRAYSIAIIDIIFINPS